MSVGTLDRTPGRSKYNEGHIPGSIFVDLDEHLATLPCKSEGRHPLPAAASFATSLGSLGLVITTLLSHTTTVAACQPAVWCGCSGFSVTTQPYLMEDYRWTGRTETSPHVRSAVDHPIREWPTELFADADAAATAGNDSSQVLIDARSPDRLPEKTSQ